MPKNLYIIFSLICTICIFPLFNHPLIRYDYDIGVKIPNYDNMQKQMKGTDGFT